MSKHSDHHGNASNGDDSTATRSESQSSSGADVRTDTTTEREPRQAASNGSTLVKQLQTIEGVLGVLVVAAIVAAVLSLGLSGQDPVQALDDAAGLPVVFFVALFVGGATGGIAVGTVRRMDLSEQRTKLKRLEQKVDTLAERTGTGTAPSSADGTLDRLLEAAEHGPVGGDALDRDATPDNQQNGQRTGDDHELTISDVPEQMLSTRLPEADTEAGQLVEELRTFDPDDPGSLKEAIEDLKYVSEDVKLVEELFASAEGGLTVPSDPTTADFQRCTDALTEIHHGLDSNATSERTPTLARAQAKRFVESYVDSVNNFQSYYDRTNTDDDDDAIDLRAARDVETDPTVNLPAGSTGKRLINYLQTAEDGRAVKRTLEETVEELNAYRSVKSTLDTEEQLRADIDALSGSIEDLRGPIADVLSEYVDAVEQLLSRTSVSQMDDAQRITIQERVNVLQDITADLRRSGRYEDSDVAQRLSELDADIESFISRYTDNRDWSHFNHGVPNQYLGLAEEFHGSAAEAAGRQDERARAYVEAAERTLELTEELYQKPKFTSLLDPTVN